MSTEDALCSEKTRNLNLCKRKREGKDFPTRGLRKGQGLTNAGCSASLVISATRGMGADGVSTKWSFSSKIFSIKFVFQLVRLEFLYVFDVFPRPELGLGLNKLETEFKYSS